MDRGEARGSFGMGRRWEGNRWRMRGVVDSGKGTGMDTQWRVWGSGLAALLFYLAVPESETRPT